MYCGIWIIDTFPVLKFYGAPVFSLKWAFQSITMPSDTSSINSIFQPTKLAFSSSLSSCNDDQDSLVDNEGTPSNGLESFSQVYILDDELSDDGKSSHSLDISTFSQDTMIADESSCVDPSESVDNESSDVSLVDQCIYVNELKETIDSACNFLYKPWRSQILMDMSFLDKKGCVTNHSNLDIMRFTSKDYSIKKRFDSDGTIVYFDLDKYPTCEKGFDSIAFKKLQEDICNASIKDGFYLIRNGFKNRQSLCAQEFVCNRYQTYRKYKKKGSEMGTVYRGHSYNANYKLSRGPEGMKMPRMTTTLKPLCSENRCKFSFFVSFDEIGFFIVPGGNNEHIHHPRLTSENINFPSRLLSKENKDLIKDINEIHACVGVSQNLIQHKTGKLLSRHKVRWLGGLCNSLQQIEDMDKNLNSTEKMIGCGPP